MMVGQRPEPFSEALGLHLVTSPLIFGEYDAVLVEAMTMWLGQRLSQMWLLCTS
jgi:hypothetical protein